MSRDGSVAPKERINIRYVPTSDDVKEDVELPLNMMVVGDFTAREDDTPIEERTPINVTKDNFNEVLDGMSPRINVAVDNQLSDEPDAKLSVDLTFKQMKDFSPENVVNSVPELQQLLELREALIALKGPLGNAPAFRKKIAALLQDEEARQKLLAELNISGKQTESV
ncbi:type VI secretion system contractile sheath small subunit [Vibrio sp.]|nr:type VI secretion system contractile sheath small subunit [Vibrio sp.]